MHCGENCCYKAPLILFISLGKLQADQRLMKKLGTLHWKFLGCFYRINSQSIKVFSPFLHSHRWFHKIASTSGFFCGFHFLASSCWMVVGLLGKRASRTTLYMYNIQVHIAWCYFCPFTPSNYFAPSKFHPKWLCFYSRTLREKNCLKFAHWQWSENKTVYSNKSRHHREGLSWNVQNLARPWNTVKFWSMKMRQSTIY